MTRIEKYFTAVGRWKAFHQNKSSTKALTSIGNVISTGSSNKVFELTLVDPT